MTKSKESRKTAQDEDPVDKLFRLSEEAIMKSPGEEICRNILDWLLQGAIIIATAYKQAPRKEKSFQANQAKRFEEKWQKLLSNFQLYADPATLRFHKLQIEEKLQSVLELATAL